MWLKSWKISNSKNDIKDGFNVISPESVPPYKSSSLTLVEDNASRILSKFPRVFLFERIWRCLAPDEAFVFGELAGQDGTVCTSVSSQEITL